MDFSLVEEIPALVGLPDILQRGRYLGANKKHSLSLSLSLSMYVCMVEGECYHIQIVRILFE